MKLTIILTLPKKPLIKYMSLSTSTSANWS